MSLTCTLETYLRFKGRKWCKLNHFKFWKIKKGLNEEISESRLMNHEKRKDEDIMSLEDEKWPLWNKKEGKEKNGKWGMKQDSTAWKFRTQNLVATYTLILRTNLEYLPKSILDILYIFLKLGKSRVQRFKYCTNRSWNEEVMVIWRQLCKTEEPFRNDFEMQLMNSKPNSKWPQYRIHPLPLQCFASYTLGIAFMALSGPHTTRNHPFIIFLVISI